MAHQLFSRIGGSPLGRAGLASFSILALVGLAANALPLTCLNAGSLVCAGDEAEVVDTAPSPASGGNPGLAVTASPPDGGELASTPSAAKPVTTVALLEQPPAPTLTKNDLIAATFQALKIELTSQPTEMTARKVKTITVNADGTPMLPTEIAVAELGTTDVDPAVAAPTPGPSPQGGEVQAAPVEVAAVPAVPTAAAARKPASAEASSPVSAYAPATGDTGVVTGKGANVRSLPNKGKSQVLFALEGGAEVTIVERRNGWMKVVDAKSRSGWIYGDYLSRG